MYMALNSVVPRVTKATQECKHLKLPSAQVATLLLQSRLQLHGSAPNSRFGVIFPRACCSTAVCHTVRRPSEVLPDAGLAVYCQ